MDQRTREWLPVLPALVSWVNAERARTGELLAAAETTRPGESFTAAGVALRRTWTLGRPWLAARRPVARLTHAPAGRELGLVAITQPVETRGAPLARDSSSHLPRRVARVS